MDKLKEQGHEEKSSPVLMRLGGLTSFKAVCVALLLLLSSGWLIADDQKTISELITSVNTMAAALSDQTSEYLLLAEISLLKSKMGTATVEEKDKAEAAIKAATEALNKKSSGILTEIIKNTRPLTAVLFSTQDRNSFEVVKNPTDSTKGIISQNQTGDTAGVLFAAESPLFFPDYPNRSVMPIGAWFGVRMQTGGGADVSGVDLAAGLSFSWVSGRTMTKIKTENDLSSLNSARLMLGVIYGEVATLGAGLSEGSEFGLGEEIPLKVSKDIAFGMGLGFRF